MMKGPTTLVNSNIYEKKYIIGLLMDDSCQTIQVVFVIWLLLVIVPSDIDRVSRTKKNYNKS